MLEAAEVQVSRGFNSLNLQGTITSGALCSSGDTFSDMINVKGDLVTQSPLLFWEIVFDLNTKSVFVLLGTNASNICKA